MTALFVDDAELMTILGIHKDRRSEILKAWEKQGFPPIDVHTRKRYLPAVRAWLDQRYGIGQNRGPLVPDGEENLEHI